MQHLFTPAGEVALAATLLRRPLLAFDFDGTLAPIVARPDDARISQAVSARLKSLAAQLPVAIVTGRAVADVRGRLGFEPRFIVGSHGAEDGLDASAAAARAGALNPVRDLLRTRGADLAAAGVGIEDKGQSIAQPGLSVQVFAGKMVVNVMAPDAPDKADAVHALVARCGAASAIFAGDDVNDEPVFVSAPPDWLTVRIGRDHPASRARYFLDSPAEMAMLLERMLVLLARIDAS